MPSRNVISSYHYLDPNVRRSTVTLDMFPIQRKFDAINKRVNAAPKQKPVIIDVVKFKSATKSLPVAGTF